MALHYPTGSHCYTCTPVSLPRRQSWLSPPYRWVACIHAKTRHNRITVDGRVGWCYLVCASGGRYSVPHLRLRLIARRYFYVCRFNLNHNLPSVKSNVLSSLIECNWPMPPSVPGVGRVDLSGHTPLVPRYLIGGIGQSQIRPTSSPIQASNP